MTKTERKIKIGTVLMLLGLVFFICAVGIAAFNIVTERKSEETAAIVTAQLPREAVKLRENEIPDYILNPKMNMPKINIAGDNYIGSVFLDEVGAVLPVMADYTSGGLLKSPCRYKGTVYRKNIIIGGRNYDSGFGKLEQLDLGSVVRFIDTDGNEFFYNIDKLDNLNNLDELDEGEWDMTLFTTNYRGTGQIALRLSLIPKEGLTWKNH